MHMKWGLHFLRKIRAMGAPSLNIRIPASGVPAQLAWAPVLCKELRGEGQVGRASWKEPEAPERSGCSGYWALGSVPC